MKLYYAFGGGLGHLCRAHALINSIGSSPEDFIVLSNSNHTELIFDQSQIIFIPQEYYQKPIELKKTIQSIISENNITEFYIDSFPYGLIGELEGIEIQDVNLFYVARILNWENYLPLMGQSKFYFNKTIVIEDLPAEQNEFIRQNSKAVIKIELIYPETKLSENAKELINSFKKPLWLIVHSEPIYELKILYQHALEIAEIENKNPEFVIISQTTEKLNLDNVKQINYFPASDFFPFAEKIFTACGFNSMHQSMLYSEKHHYIPFARKFDNQFLRAKYRKLKLNKLL
jgi:hypothetical protein